MKTGITLILSLVSLCLSAQPYRFLKIETSRCSNHKWQEIEWFVADVAYPQVKMTSNTSNGMVASGQGGESYLPYDGDPGTHAWIGEIAPPLTEDLILDLGAGNELDPDSMRFTKPTYSLVYDFRVWASNDEADWVLLLDVKDLSSSGHAQMTFPLEVIIDTDAPSKPVNTSLVSATTNSLFVTWDESVDDREVAGYDVYLDDALYGSTPVNSMLIPGLTEGTTYSVWVRAYDKAGNRSENGDTLTASTKIPDVEPPTSPTGLVLDAAGYDFIEFSWEASTDNEELGGYVVWLQGKVAGIAATNSFVIPGLEPDSIYIVRVYARDASGNISESFAEGEFRTNSGFPERMPIGTNFWNISWGGSANDPFNTGYQSVSGDNPWKQAFLDETAIYSHFRFMDYLETNNSDFSHWKDRVKKTDLLQKPMAFEWMIDLCNRQDADLWITVPHMIVSADGMEGGENHFMKKLAVLVKTGIDLQNIDLDDPAFSNLSEMTPAELKALGGIQTCEPLKPGLKFYVEYSNETWNGSFGQFQYCVDEGVKLGLPGDQYSAGRKFHAWAALRLFEATEDVFGEANPGIMRMDAYQAVVPSQIIDHYNVYKDETLNPREIYPDAFCPAPYFGNGVNGGAGDVVDLLINGSSGIIARTGSVKEARRIMNVENGKGFPVKKLIAYEGGQHILTNAQLSSRNPAMYTLYVQYLDSMNSYLDEFSHYVHSGSFSSGGAWGSKESIGQDQASAHKYRAIYEWLNGTAVRPDSQAPEVPGGLSVSALGDNGYTLHWNPSVDDDAVSFYSVMVDGNVYTPVNDTFLAVDGLLPGRTYMNSVSATDPAGNSSAYSDEFPVTTTGIASYSVSFTVYVDETEKAPVEGAVIGFNDASGTTNASGIYIFESVPAGNSMPWTVSVNSELKKEGSLDVVDEDVQLEVYLLPGVGIEDFSTSLRVYPNPAQDFIRVESEKLIEGIKLFREDGSLLREHSLDRNNAEISLNGLPTGIFYVRIKFADESKPLTISVIRESGN